MSLVAYPDSDSDDSSTGRPDNPPAKRTKLSAPAPTSLPPLPASFHDLYATSSRLSTRDDPSLHQGRKRAVPHVEGNWPTHVYLEWHPNSSEASALNDLVTRIQRRQSRSVSDPVQQTPDSAGRNNSVVTAENQHGLSDNPKQVQSLLQSALSAPLPLHISLSRSLVLQTPQRDAFLDAIASHLLASGVRPFTVRFGSLKWVPNFERTRWFLVTGLERPDQDELNRLLNACNDTARSFGLGALYERDEFCAESARSAAGHKQKSNSKDGDRSDRFHISLAWTLEAPSAEYIDPLSDPQIARFVQESITDSLSVKFDVVKVKIGNAVHSLKLNTKAVVESTAFI